MYQKWVAHSPGIVGLLSICLYKILFDGADELFYLWVRNAELDGSGFVRLLTLSGHLRLDAVRVLGDCPLNFSKLRNSVIGFHNNMTPRIAHLEKKNIYIYKRLKHTKGKFEGLKKK